jgi:hypothetical protein
MLSAVMHGAGLQWTSPRSASGPPALAPMRCTLCTLRAELENHVLYITSATPLLGAVRGLTARFPHSQCYGDTSSTFTALSGCTTRLRVPRHHSDVREKAGKLAEPIVNACNTCICNAVQHSCLNYVPSPSSRSSTASKNASIMCKHVYCKGYMHAIFTERGDPSISLAELLRMFKVNRMKVHCTVSGKAVLQA